MIPCCLNTHIILLKSPFLTHPLFPSISSHTHHSPHPLFFSHTHHSPQGQRSLRSVVLHGTEGYSVVLFPLRCSSGLPEIPQSTVQRLAEKCCQPHDLQVRTAEVCTYTTALLVSVFEHLYYSGQATRAGYFLMTVLVSFFSLHPTPLLVYPSL